MFHSRGTVQSNTWVPLGTSCTVRSISSRRMPRVWRWPSPVRLRQMGYSFSTRRYRSAPAVVSSGAFADCREPPAKFVALWIIAWAVVSMPRTILRLEHSHLGHGHHELAAAFLIFLLLRDDLIGEIPRQQQDIVR